MAMNFHSSEDISQTLETTTSAEQLLVSLGGIFAKKPDHKISSSSLGGIIGKIKDLSTAKPEIVQQILILCLKNTLDVYLKNFYTLLNDEVPQVWPQMLAIFKGDFKNINASIPATLLDWGFKNGWDFMSKQINQNETLDLYVAMIKNGMQRGFIEKLASLYAYDQSGFKAAMQSPELTKYREMLELCISENFSAQLCEYIYKFSEFGRIDAKDAFVACAAIKAQRKSSDSEFNPVIVAYDELDDFYAHLSANRSAYQNKNIKLLITGDHWMTGEILITADSVRMFFVDSFGKDSLFTDTRRLAKKHFSENLYIQHNDFRSQWTEKGCSFFAIDYLRKLCKTPSIFSILPTPTQVEEVVAVPLTMLRSAQVTNLPEVIHKHPDYKPDMIVKHRPEPLSINAAIMAHFTKQMRKGELKATNLYLDAKMENLGKKVVHYLLATPAAQVSKDCEQFTASALFKRHARKPPPPPSRTSSSRKTNLS